MQRLLSAGRLRWSSIRAAPGVPEPPSEASFLHAHGSASSAGIGDPVESQLRSNPQEVAVGVNEKRKLDSKPRLKAKHLKPRLDAKYGVALSTFCVAHLNDVDRWCLLLEFVKPNLVARAEFEATVFLDAGLALDADWEPRRHVNVHQWPKDDEAQTSIAQELLYNHQRLIERSTA